MLIGEFGSIPRQRRELITMSGLGFDLLPQSFSLLPGAVERSLDKVSGTIGQVGAAAIPLGTGLLVIVGSALLPKEPKWMTWVKVGGIAVGAYMGVSGAMYAMKPKGLILPSYPKNVTFNTLTVSGDLDMSNKADPKAIITIKNVGPIIGLVLSGDVIRLSDNVHEGILPAQSVTVPSQGFATVTFHMSAADFTKFPDNRTLTIGVIDAGGARTKFGEYNILIPKG